MAKRQSIPTPEAIRKAYIQEFLKRNENAEAFAGFTETELAAFIRRYDSEHFPGIYACLDHNFYDRVRNKIATDREMAALDKETELAYSVHLKAYSDFLKSKAFRNLYKRKINLEGAGKKTKPAPTPSVPEFREETEGERKHIAKEMEVIRRNPRLRQQCLDRYGYQCQCCGMDFAEIYGEELGARFMEVHHLKPISRFEKDGIPDDFVENLVPLCSNCHAMIHHIGNSEHPLRDLREAYKGEKKEIRIWKED